MIKLLKKILIAIIIMNSCNLICKDVWIYSDDGTWEDGIIALEQFFDYYGITHERVMADDLNNIADYSEAKAICIPGGYAYNYKIALSPKTIDNIRSYVANGGAYIGVCAGAFFACSEVTWEGIEYPYALSLFEGKAIGSIYEIAFWDNYAMTKININQKNKIIQNAQNNLTVLYYGGPYFVSDKTNFDTIATWEEYNDYPSIINFQYENGKVLLIGPHLEIEENNSRDSTQFAEELNDVESDWDFLSTILYWVLENNTSVAHRIRDNNIKISPNPVQDYIELDISPLLRGAGGVFEIAIYNVLGEKVFTLSRQSPAMNLPLPRSLWELRIDVSHLPTGMYFIKIGDQIEKFAKK
jgi:glutamine amidotransferase-like uncharacterized protein